MNAFDLAEASVTIHNVTDVIELLNTTYPLEFEKIADKLENCNLDNELQNVSCSMWESS